jgi:hypothetical protein
MWQNVAFFMSGIGSEEWRVESGEQRSGGDWEIGD